MKSTRLIKPLPSAIMAARHNIWCAGLGTQMPMTHKCPAKTPKMHQKYYSSRISKGKEREAPEDFGQDQSEAS